MLPTLPANNDERLKNLDVFKNVLHPYQFYHQVPYNLTRGKTEIVYMVEKAIDGRRSFSRLDLSGLGLGRANISCGDFRQSKLIMSGFVNTNCTDTNFEGADLTGAIFINSNLGRANFKNANLSLATITDNCSFHQANFEGAIFDGTIFQGEGFNLDNLLNQKVKFGYVNNYGNEDGTGRIIPAGENPRNDNTRGYCGELIPLVDDIIEEPDNNIIVEEIQNDPKQQRIEELERELLLYKERLRLCHERLRHEELENERLHHQCELREQEDELGQNDLSFGQDQLNQHEELELEQRKKSSGGSRKKTKSKKSNKSRRYKMMRNTKKK
jgi:uncharacterized protein YjbI with pentapeptide repeats